MVPLVMVAPSSHLLRGAWIEIYLSSPQFFIFFSRTSYEVRGLKCKLPVQIIRPLRRRTSYEVRGLKFLVPAEWMGQIVSHLLRGAWIEIPLHKRPKVPLGSHLLRGAWIEMASAAPRLRVHFCRTSYEVRGLKFFGQLCRPAELVSHLLRGAWIEISSAFR